MNPLKDLLARWKEEAETLHRRGATGRADLMEALAEELGDAVEAWREAELSIEEAAAWSGYSAERIRELVREGMIPDRRPTGARQGTEYRVRRSDLPRHPIGKREPDSLPRPGRKPEGNSPATRAARRALGGSRGAS